MIIYFYRNHKVGYSIKKVADLITNQVLDKRIYEMPSPFASVVGILRNLLFTFVHRDKKCVNHVVGDVHYCIISLFGCKSVLTIHDTVAYDNAVGWKKLVIKYLWFVWPLKFAHKIVCVSSATRESLYRFTGRKDIVVLYNAVDPQYIYSSKTFNKECPTILLIGTNWNKNIDRTFYSLRGIKCKLNIIGVLGDEQIKYLDDNDFIYENKVGLSDDEIRQEYENCDIVSFCSLYEGFGMPVIEANAIGRPVITSNIEPLKEVAGNAAIYVDPYDVSDMRHKFIRLINDRKLRDTLIENGRMNVKRFNDKSIFSQYNKIYESMG